MAKTLLLLLLFLFCRINSVVTQSSSELQLTVEQKLLGSAEGLEGEFILKILQDSLGFYWVADRRGLMRYDGQSFKRFSYKSLGVNVNGFPKITTDESGMIWIATYKHNLIRSSYDTSVRYSIIKIFNPYQETIIPFEDSAPVVPFKTDDVFAYNYDGNHLHISTREGKVFRYQSGKYILVYEDDCWWPPTCTAWSEKDGKYYFTFGFELYQWTGTSPPEKISTLGLKAPALVCNNNFLVAHSSGQVDAFDPFSEVYRTSADAKPKLLFKEKDVLFHGFRNQYQIWLRKEQSLDLYSIKAGDTTIQSLWSIPVTDFDYQLNLLGAGCSIGETVWMYNGRECLLMRFKPQNNASFTWGAGHSVRDIAQLSDSLLLSTTYNGMKTINPYTGTVQSACAKVGDGGFSIDVTNDRILIGRHGFSFAEYTKEEIFNKIKGQEHRGVNSSCLHAIPGPKDTVWLGTRKGLAFHVTDEAIAEWYPDIGVPALNRAVVHQMINVPEGVWLATGEGAYLFDSSTKSVVDSFDLLAPQEYVSIYRQARDSIWLIPKHGNPVLWDRADNTLFTLDIYRKALGNSLHTILQDKLGCYWLPSNNGLYRYDPLTGQVRQLTKEQNNLPHNEFNHVAWEVLDDGKLAFGGVDGMCLIDPLEFVPSTEQTSPVFRITDISMKSDQRDTSFVVERALEQKIYLPAHQQALFVDFSWLTPFQEGLQYYMCLDANGKEKKWEPLHAGKVMLERLSSGDHTLELAVREGFNQRMSAYQKLNFSVRKPWYIQWWFLLIVATGGIYSLRKYLDYRLNLAKKKAKVLEGLVQKRTEELEKERRLIAHQNDQLLRLNKAKDSLYALITHEIKGPLLGVLGLSKKIDFLLQQNRPQDVQRLSRKIDQNARDVSFLLDNLISWGKAHFEDDRVIAPEANSIRLVVERLWLDFEEVAQQKGIQLDNQLSEGATIAFDPQALSVILRNLLHNAVKFSFSDTTIRVLQEPIGGNQFALRVVNRGIPLKAETIKALEQGANINSTAGTGQERGSGIGLRLCCILARRSNAKLRFEPLSEQLTQVSIIIPAEMCNES